MQLNSLITWDVTSHQVVLYLIKCIRVQRRLDWPFSNLRHTIVDQRSNLYWRGKVGLAKRFQNRVDADKRCAKTASFENRCLCCIDGK